MRCRRVYRIHVIQPPDLPEVDNVSRRERGGNEVLRVPFRDPNINIPLDNVHRPLNR